MKRKSRREELDRNSGFGRGQRKKAPGQFEKRDRTPSPVKYGMDAETEERV